MAVQSRGLSVSCPSGVGDTCVGSEGGIKVGLGLIDEFLKLCDLSDLLVSENLPLLIPINGYTCGIITTVLQTGKTCSNKSQVNKCLIGKKIAPTSRVENHSGANLEQVCLKYTSCPSR